MTTEELIAEIERLDAAATPNAARQIDLLVHAARIDPILRDAAYEVDAAMFANAQLIASYRTLAVEAARRLRVLERALGDRTLMRGFYDAMDAADAGDTGKTLAEIREEHGLES